MRTVLSDIPFKSDPVFLARWLGKAAADSEEMRDMLKVAESIGRSKAILLELKAEVIGDDFAVVQGVRFSSRVLARNLGKSPMAFPFAASCGVELEEWAEGMDGPDKLLAQAVMGLGLGQAVAAIDREIAARHGPGNIGMMNPGSLPDWPMSEQINLFGLLGDTKGDIGVELLENLFMRPAMSASGIKFYSDFKYENCMLCDKDPCPGRRAAYSAELAEKYAK